jgi:hypothetical protein
MKYIVYSLDWSKPVYFCPHAGSGFTVSTDINKAEQFPNKIQAQNACSHFASQSNMKCDIKKM